MGDPCLRYPMGGGITRCSSRHKDNRYSKGSQESGNILKHHLIMRIIALVLERRQTSIGRLCRALN